jgi:hypothetical protein
MPTINLKINLVDKRKIFPMKAKYNPETRLAQVQRGLRQMFPTRFQVDPDHIYESIKGKKSEAVCFVDNASRKSIEVDKVKTREIIEDGKHRTETETIKEIVQVGESKTIHSEDPVDGAMKNTLDYLVEEKFWKSLIAKAKLPLSTVLIVLFAGGGLFYLLIILLRAFGLPV